jgi:hypothetical protein
MPASRQDSICCCRSVICSIKEMNLSLRKPLMDHASELREVASDAGFWVMEGDLGSLEAIL